MKQALLVACALAASACTTTRDHHDHFEAVAHPPVMLSHLHALARQTNDARREALVAMLRSHGFEPELTEFPNAYPDRGDPRATGANVSFTVGEGDREVIVGAHYDGIEMAIRLVAEAARATHGVRSGVLVRRHNDPCIEAVIDAGRTRYVDLTIDKKDVSRFAGVVRDGSAVFYVPDQDASRRNAFVPFFGVPASTLAAIPGVLRRSGGVPLLFWCRRVGDGRFSIDIARAPEDFLEGADADVAARYMAWVERRARQSPEQYLWVHRRFKTRPPGEPDLYGRERSARSPSP